MSENTSAEPRETNFPDIASEYDAFISYKHGPVDSAAARALQKNLEHFRVPIVAGHLPRCGQRFFDLCHAAEPQTVAVQPKPHADPVRL